jgi:hypothetical protein
LSVSLVLEVVSLIASIEVRNRYRIDELTTVDGNRKVLRPIFIEPKTHEKTRKILRILKNKTMRNVKKFN